MTRCLVNRYSLRRTVTISSRQAHVFHSPCKSTHALLYRDLAIKADCRLISYAQATYKCHWIIRPGRHLAKLLSRAVCPGSYVSYLSTSDDLRPGRPLNYCTCNFSPPSSNTIDASWGSSQKANIQTIFAVLDNDNSPYCRPRRFTSTCIDKNIAPH